MKAVNGQELFLSAENKVGRLCEIAKLVKDANINIRAISAYVVEEKAYIRLVTSDNMKASKTLEKIGRIESKEVIIVEMTDEVGRLYDFTAKLKDANISLTHIYGTTVQSGRTANIIFSSDNNKKALEILAAL